MIKRLLQKAICDKGLYVFYRYDPTVQDQGRFDRQVQLFTRYEDVPAEWRIVLRGSSPLDPMPGRMRRGRTRLLCIGENGLLIAYGWVQDWRLFLRKFGWLTREGTMLGPFWTHPDYRGRGLYGRLLGHGLTVCDRSKPIIIYTTTNNRASQRGIEKAGFQYIGCHQVALYFRLFVRHRPGEFSRADAPGGTEAQPRT